MKRPNPKNYKPTDFIRGVYENDLEKYIDYLEQNQAKLQQHGVMQAEASGGAEGATVGNSADGKGMSVELHECPVCKQKAGKSYLLSKLPTICQKCDHAWNRA